LLCDGINIFLNVDKVPETANGCVTTIIMGQFLVQTLTVHYPAQYDRETVVIHCGDGPWDQASIGIHPSTSRIEWPPPLIFTERGPMSYTRLLNRWKRGKRA
jgi:hypothetical protein